MDPVSVEFVCTHVSPIPDFVHVTNEKPSLKLLLEESRTPSTSVVTRAELYSLTNASLKTTMPETGTNGAVGGKNPVTGPPKTDDSANTGPRNKDSSNRGTPSHNNKRRGKDGPDGATPRKTPGRERYALLVGVEVIPQPGAVPGPRSVPPHAWTDQIIRDYVSPVVPDTTSLVVLNPMEFILFRGSRSAGEGYPFDEAVVASAALHDIETIWVGKMVRMRCVPRTLKEASNDIEASREYVRRFTQERITAARVKRNVEVHTQRLREMPRTPSPRGRGYARRADRYAAQQLVAHQHSPERDRPLYAAREPEDRAPEPGERAPAPEPRDNRNDLEPWQYGMFPAATPPNENQFASADESSFSSMSGSEDDLTEDEDDDDVVGYNTETSRHTTVGERNRRRNRGRRRTARRARRDRHATRNNRNPKFLDIALFKDSQADNAISYHDWRDQVQGYIRRRLPETQIRESVLSALEGTPKDMALSDNDRSLRGILNTLDRIYGGATSFNKLNAKLSSITQGYSESVMDYFTRLTNLRTRLNKHHGHFYREGQLDQQSKEAFFGGLRPEYKSLVSHVKDDATKTTLDLFTSVRECEENEEDNRRSRRADYARAYQPPAKGHERGGYTPARPREGYPARGERNSVPVKALAVGPEEEAEFYQNHPREFNTPEPLDGEDPELEMLTNFYAAAVQLADGTERRNGSCYNCREMGHRWRDCPQPLREEFRVYQETMKRRREMMLNANGGPGTQGGRVPQASPPAVPLPVPATPQQ